MGSPRGNRERRHKRRLPSPSHAMASKHAPGADNVCEKGRRNGELERSIYSAKAAGSCAMFWVGVFAALWESVVNDQAPV